MHLAILIALQLAAVPAPMVGFDLAKVKPPTGCDPGNGDIVVCGRITSRHRLGGGGVDPYPLHKGLDKAEIGVAGKLRATTEVESAAVGGFPSNRVMLRLKLPF